VDSHVGILPGAYVIHGLLPNAVATSKIVKHY
jgi:hypothetical protein